MDKTIYMPDDEQGKQMMRDAWAAFKKKAEENGFKLGDGAMELFIVGYCYGNNDCLFVIRDQIAMDGYRIKRAKVPGKEES